MATGYLSDFILAIVIGFFTYRSFRNGQFWVKHGFLRFVVATAVGVVSFFVLAVGEYLFRPDSVLIEEQLAKLRSNPVVALYMSETPEAEQNARDFVTAIVKKKAATEIESARFWQPIAEWKQSHLAPALLKASGDLVVAIVKSEFDLVDYVRVNDSEMCKSAALNRNLNELNSRGRQIAQDIEKNYRLAFKDGASGSSQSVMTADEASAVIDGMGITAVEKEVLSQPDTHSDAQVCNATYKVLKAQIALSEDKKLPFMRWYLTE